MRGRLRGETITVVFLLSLTMAGCNQGFSSQQLSALNAGHDMNAALARDHKITYVEAARRDGEAANKMSNGRLTSNDRLLLALRLALAAEVDAGRMTPELADLRVQERIAEMNAAEQARQAAVSQALIAAGTNMMAPPPRPVTCTSSQMGGFVTTHCN